MSFVDKGIEGIGELLRTTFIQWEFSAKNGYLQRIDARIKILFLLFFIVIINLKRDLVSEFLIALIIFLLAVLSRLNLFDFYRKVLISAFLFGTLLSLPASLNLIMDGNVIFSLINFKESYEFWIYRIPQTIGITEEGASVVILLTSRVMNSVGLSLLILYTTPFPEMIRALKMLRVPDTLLIIITLTYKYIFIFAKTVSEMHLARKSRMISSVSREEAGRWIAGRIFLLFKRTQKKCEELNKAMIGRGFSDSINIYEYRKIKFIDMIIGMTLLFTGIIILCL